ncbi:hypothetical protein [Aeromicrobium sp. 179-A 4D2 NHS]|uniref:hypothetical protein n=1 Tax=Aeromicrobium sp. 179-A 4D2 NHS TaxID=3142375 RepID=UPI00399F596C
MTTAVEVLAYRAAYVEVTEDETAICGWGIVIEGVDHPVEQIEAAVRHEHGDGWERLATQVEHLQYVPRIKRCERLDGWGCDFEGEWHAHWTAVRHNDAAKVCCHTVVVPVWERPGTKVPS